jgi:hypothetical protein
MLSMPTFVMLLDIAGFALVEALEVAIDVIDARFVVFGMGSAGDVAVVTLGTVVSTSS